MCRNVGVNQSKVKETIALSIISVKGTGEGRSASIGEAAHRCRTRGAQTRRSFI